MYGYPGVLNQSVNENNYLCVSHAVEYGFVQPLRLMSVLAGLYIMTRDDLQKDEKIVKGAALGVVLWSSFVWYQAQSEMSQAYRSLENPYAGG
jgi:hypothetical protein